MVSVPAPQIPFKQLSPVVQALPSLQTVSSAFGVSTQNPVPGLHTPVKRQSDSASHSVVDAGVHSPDWQVSFNVHRLLSSHVLPSDTGGSEQKPVAESQRPIWWH